MSLVSLAALLFEGSSLLLNQSSHLRPELDELERRRVHYQVLDEQTVETEHPATHERHRYPIDGLLSPRQPRYPLLPTLSINLLTIDTNFYSNRYHYASSIPCTSGEGQSLHSADLNRNSRKEIYGIHRGLQDPGPTTRIYEMDDSLRWNTMHVYPAPTGVVEGIDDLDRNGLFEIYARYSNFVHVYEQASLNEYPVVQKFTHQSSVDGGIAIPMVLANVGGDSANNLIYRGSEEDSLSITYQKVYITRYDQAISNLRRIWSEQLSPECIGDDCTDNIAVGDFDSDGRQSIVTSAFSGNCYMIKHVEQDSFLVAWSDSLSVAGRVAAGDVDGNGIEEFFIGGNQLEGDGYVHLRAYAYEKVGENIYQPYFGFNVFPVAYFHGDLYQTADIDGDGQEELLVSIGNGDLIIKGAGTHEYALFYYKRILSYSDGMSAVDINGDRFPELLLSTFESGRDVLTNTSVFQLDTAIAAVSGEQGLKAAFSLTQNYPNPFNPITTIKYALPQDTHVSLAVYNVLGCQVGALESGFKHAGNYTARFDASGLASGMYFCRLQANGFTLVRKMVVVK